MGRGSGASAEPVHDPDNPTCGLALSYPKPSDLLSTSPLGNSAPAMRQPLHWRGHLGSFPAISTAQAGEGPLSQKMPHLPQRFLYLSVWGDSGLPGGSTMSHTSC